MPFLADVEIRALVERKASLLYIYFIEVYRYNVYMKVLMQLL